MTWISDKWTFRSTWNFSSLPDEGFFKPKPYYCTYSLSFWNVTFYTPETVATLNRKGKHHPIIVNWIFLKSIRFIISPTNSRAIDTFLIKIIIWPCSNTFITTIAFRDVVFVQRLNCIRHENRWLLIGHSLSKIFLCNIISRQPYFYLHWQYVFRTLKIIIFLISYIFLEW